MQSNGILFQHSKHNWKRLHCWTKIFLKRYACICILLYNVHTQQTKYMQKQSTMHSGNTKNTTITWHNWNSLHWWTKLFHRDTHAYTTVHYTTVQVYNVQCKISMYKFNRYPPHMTPPWMATQHNQAPQHHHATRPNISPSPNSIHYPPRLLPNMDYHREGVLWKRRLYVLPRAALVTQKLGGSPDGVGWHKDCCLTTGGGWKLPFKGKQFFQLFSSMLMHCS